MNQSHGTSSRGFRATMDGMREIARATAQLKKDVQALIHEMQKLGAEAGDAQKIADLKKKLGVTKK